MRRGAALLLCAALFPLTLAAPARADDVDNAKAVLSAHGVPTDAEKLRDYVAGRVLSKDDVAAIAGHIARLGADTFAEREAATKALVAAGPKARALVRRASESADNEVRRRARRVLEGYGPAESDNSVFPAAARVLAAVRPAGADKALLDVLPFVHDREAVEETVAAMRGLAGTKGKAPAALVAELASADADRRSAAGVALSAHKGEHRPAVLKLLADPDVAVRRRVATALFESREGEAVPALAKLLESPRDKWGLAEEMLQSVAGDKSPAFPEGGDTEANRRAYAKEWAGWWDGAKAKVDLAKADFNGVGRGLLVVGYSGVVKAGKVGYGLEVFGPDMRSRWKLDELPRYPTAATLSRFDRIIVADNNQIVAERNKKGEAIWEKNVGDQVVGLQRLGTGDILVVCRNRLKMLDRGGKEIKSIDRPAYDTIAAHRRDDGTFVLLTQAGNIVTLDREGKQTGSVSTGSAVTGINGMRPHFLPNGNVVVPNYIQNKVTEYDAKGKELWSVTTSQRPIYAYKLPNGNVQVGLRLRPAVVEIDPKSGKTIETTSINRAMFFDRR